MQSRIILIGYRATGKSTIGEELSRRLNCKLLDTDRIVEERSGKTIADIFAEEGEASFRDREMKAVEEAVAYSVPCVISTGGGAILRESNRRRLSESGFVVWLTASRETIWNRMHSDAKNAQCRPPLTDLSPLLEIEKVLQVREPLYAETASLIIKTDHMGISEISANIIERFSAHNK